jgi:GT2 family glycosyltransferase
MNLKESKQSNCLVAMYLYEMPDLRNLSECLYSLAEQTKPIDLVIYTHGLTDEQIEQIKADVKMKIQKNKAESFFQ